MHSRSSSRINTVRIVATRNDGWLNPKRKDCRNVEDHRITELLKARLKLLR